MDDETDLVPTSDAPEGEPHSSGEDRWDSVFGPSGAYEAPRAERGNGASWKTGANIVLAFAILLLIPGVVVFVNTKGGLSIALIGGVMLALVGGSMRGRASRGTPDASPPPPRPDMHTPVTGNGWRTDEGMHLPPMLTWPAPSSTTDLFPYRGKEYSLGLVHRNDRSRYVIEDESGISVGDFTYASDGLLVAWRFVSRSRALDGCTHRAVPTRIGRGTILFAARLAHGDSAPSRAGSMDRAGR